MIASEVEIICILCARGCPARVREEGGEVRVRGELCRNGRAYVRQEFRDPRRVLTTTVRLEGAQGGRLPVRTRGPIPKGRLMECMRAIGGLRVRPPVRVGDVLVADLLGTGQDLIASGELAGREERRNP